MPNTDKEYALALCNRLKCIIREGLSDSVTISTGHALYQSEGNTIED